MRRISAIFATLFLSACAGIPATHYYELRLLPGRDGETAAQDRLHGLEVGVRLFRVDPPYDQDRIVYRVGETSPEIRFYAYHRWAVPLSRMLPVVAAQALGGTAGIASIEPYAPGRDYDAMLEGRLLALEEIDLPEGQLVRVRLALRLVGSDGAELWSGTAAEDKTAQLAEVRQVVEHMILALEEALDGVSEGLEGALGAPL